MKKSRTNVIDKLYQLAEQTQQVHSFDWIRLFWKSERMSISSNV